LLVVDPVSATLGSEPLAAAARLDRGADSGDIRSLRLSGAVALTLAAAAIVHTGLDIFRQKPSGRVLAKGFTQMGRCSSAGILTPK